MDGFGKPADQPAEARASQDRWGEPDDRLAGTPRAGQGTPLLTLEGFHGPLDHLLTLARAQTIALSDISLAALLDQLAAALRQAPVGVSLGQKGNWVVMAAWLVQLRSRLLLPVDAAAQQDAVVQADDLRGRLIALQTMQALAAWLERRPQLGHDGFARGQPEVLGVSVENAEAIDVIEFLWASLALFDETAAPETTTLYRARPFDPYPVAEARDRILQRLAAMPAGGSLDRFLPDPPEADDAAEDERLSQRRRRAAWASTLSAGLELAKQGDVALAQAETFQSIHVAPMSIMTPH